MKEKIMVIGGDKRSFYLTKALFDKGYNACWYACENFPCQPCAFVSKEDFRENLTLYDIMVLPLPHTRDHKHLNTPFSNIRIELDELMRLTDGKCVFASEDMAGTADNYFSAKEVVIANARLTAVGLLKELLCYTECDIMNKSVLVTGFGNVGKAVAKILDNNGLRVTVCARNKEQRVLAGIYGYDFCSIDEGGEKICNFDFVVNTVPFQLFDDKVLRKTKKECIFFELAKGLMPETCSDHSTYISCKGMPGKHTPQAAGKVIADYISEKTGLNPLP